MSPEAQWAGAGGTQLLRRPVRIRLRSGRTVEGSIHISEGQPLVGFFAMKRHFLNLTEARWLDGSDAGTTLPYLGLRISRILWVEPLEGALHLSSAIAPTSAGRAVELVLVDGLAMHVRLHIAEELRMSDYFDSNPSFIPLRDVRVLGSGEGIDRLAVNHEAVLAIRELE